MIIPMEVSKKGGVELRMEIKFLVKETGKMTIQYEDILEAFKEFMSRCIDESFKKEN